MITIRAGKAAIGVCLLVLAGCSREQQDWRSAEAADSIEAYDQFIQRHPESELATQARTRVAQLGEDRDWQRAGSADSVDAYRQFITQHPNGKWTQEARIRVENFSLGEQAASVGGAGTGTAGAAAAGGPGAGVAPGAGGGAATAAGGAGAARAGGGSSGGGVASTAGGGVATGAAMVARPPVSAPAGATKSGAYGVQLGAFGSEAAANMEWHLLTGRFSSELQGLSEHVVMAETGSGRIYRLQAVVGEESRARAICDSLRKSSQACVAVLPH